MKSWRSILLAIRPQLILLAIALLLALLMGGGGLYLEERSHEALRQQTLEAQRLQSDLSTRQQDLLYLSRHIEAFERLKEQGLLSLPDRENWVENLLTTRHTLRLPETLAYTLTPAHPLDERPLDPNAPTANEPPPADSPLIYDLQISLNEIHEGELLNFLAAFQASIKEHFRVQSCLLNHPEQTGLQAQCTLRFFTLPPPAAETTAP